MRIIEKQTDNTIVWKDGDETIVQKFGTVKADGDGGMVILSDESRDSDGDIIRQSGWDFARFDKNPTMLWGHDYRGFPIGNWKDYKVDGSRFIGRPNFAAKENPSAKIAQDLHKAGFLPAVSVSFKPTEWKELDDGGREYLAQELFEVSFVSVPANPNALTLSLDKAVAKGIISADDKVAVEKEMAYAQDAHSAEDPAPARGEDDMNKELRERIDKIQAKIHVLEELESITRTLSAKIDELGERLDAVRQGETQDKGDDQAVAEKVLAVSITENAPANTIDPDAVKSAIRKEVGGIIAEVVEKKLNHFLGKVG